MRPSILIGLGGTGSSIVHNVYKRLSENERKKLAVFVFDTDEGDLKKLSSFRYDKHLINLGQNKTVSRFLSENSMRLEEFQYLETDREILQKNMSRGAAQVRMLSRLAYEVMDDDQFAKIDKQIRTVFSNAIDGVAANIYFVTSLCGGTGSGILLQLAFLLKNYVSKVHNRDVFSKAVVLFPDIFTSSNDVGVNLEASEKLRMSANTYAFFKEWKTYNDIFQGEYTYGKEHIKNLSLNIGQMGGGLSYLNENNLSETSGVLNPIDIFAGIDAVGTGATNLINKKNYEEMTEDFLFLDIATNIGSATESRVDNALTQAVRANGLNKLSSFGVAKLIYPYEDLLTLAPAIQISEILSDSWLTIDNRFEIELNDYDEKRRRGELNLQEPRRKEFFIAAINEYAESGHNKNYFKILLQSLTQVTHDEFNTESGRYSLDNMYIDNVREHLKLQIRNSKYTTPQNEEVKLLDYFDKEINKKLKNLDAGLESIEETVNRIENLKSGLNQQVFNVFEAKYDALCSNYLNMSEENLSNFDIQKNDKFNLSYYLLGMNKDSDHRKPLHPLAVRYLLYKVQKILQHELRQYKTYEFIGTEKTEAGKLIKLEKSIDKFRNIDYFDETPEKDDIAKAVALCQDVDSKFFNKTIVNIFGKTRIKELLNFYKAKTLLHLSALKEYYTASLEYNVLVRLESKISNLIDYWETFYKKLSTSVTNETSRVNSILHEFGANEQSHSVTGKFQLFDEFENRKKFILERFEQEGFDFEDFEHELTEILYKEALVDYSMFPRKKTKDEILSRDFEELALEKLRLNIKNKNILDLNVAEALQAEAIMKGINTPEYIGQTLSYIADKAGPFMNPSHNESKRSFNTWGINEEVSENLHRILNNQQQYSDIFGSQNVVVQGETINPNDNIFYEQLESINKYEIIRSNYDYNFGMVNISSFLSDNDTSQDPTLDTIFTNGGRLFQSYYEHKLDEWLNNDVSCHLDNRWDGLFILNDINQGIDELLQKETKKAFIRGLALKYFVNTKDTDGDITWRLNLPDDNHTFIKDKYNEPIGPFFYDLYNALIDNIGIVLSINGYRNPSNIVTKGFFQQQFEEDYYTNNYTEWADHFFMKKSRERIQYSKHPKIKYNLLDACFTLHEEINTGKVKKLGKELLELVITEYIDYHKKVYGEGDYSIHIKNAIKKLLEGSAYAKKSNYEIQLRGEWKDIMLNKVGYKNNSKVFDALFLV